MHDVAWRGIWICVRSKDAQKQLARTSLIREVNISHVMSIDSLLFSLDVATGIATSGQVQLRKSAIHGLPVTLRMVRVKSDKSDRFWSQSIVFTKPFKARMSLDLA